VTRLRGVERLEQLEQEKGWATRLLQWTERGSRFEAGDRSARYFVTGGRYEALGAR
jgi:hypothetical protein